jgi:hypothetical protein
MIGHGLIEWLEQVQFPSEALLSPVDYQLWISSLYNYRQ